MRRPLLILCVLLMVAGAGFGEADFSGDYTIASPQGSMSLTLRQAGDGTVTGSITLAGGTCDLRGAVVVDDDDEISVEGTMTCAAGGGEFTFSSDEEDGDFYLLVTPYDASGVPRSDLATLYFAQRGDEGKSGGEDNTSGEDKPIDTNAAPAPPPAGGLHDPRLVGVWATQVIMNTPGGNMATQLVMEIRGDGMLVDLGSRSIGGTADGSIDTGTSGGGETMVWRTNGDILEVSYAGSQWVQLARFEVSGDRLLLSYYDGDRKLWQRQ